MDVLFSEIIDSQYIGTKQNKISLTTSHKNENKSILYGYLKWLKFLALYNYINLNQGKVQFVLHQTKGVEYFYNQHLLYLSLTHSLLTVLNPFANT